MFRTNYDLISADDDGEFRAKSPLNKQNSWIDFSSIDNFISDIQTVFPSLKNKTDNDYSWMVHDESKEEYRFVAWYDDSSNWCEGTAVVAKLDYNSKAKAAQFKTTKRIELGGNAKPNIEFRDEYSINTIFEKVVTKYKI